MYSLTLAVTALAAFSVRAASATDVFAHFMVQNAWAYNQAQWKADMQSAKSIGIDAFAMNWMPPDCQSGLSWQESRIDDAYKAAEEVGFKLTHSFDMSWTECNNGGYWNTTYMADVLQKHASSKATYRWNSNMLVTTYGGDAVKQYGNLFFADLKLKMRLSGNAISFTPALTTYSTKAQNDAEGAAYEMIQDFPTTDGYFNWQAWPMSNNINNTCTPDEAFQYQMKKAGKTGPYIMAVSPWQFKDLDNGSGSDAWVAPGDWLFVKRLEAIAQQDVKPDIIELLTWNDWCESHYLRDLPGNSTSATDYADLSNMEAYVSGQNHSPWRIITKYYISWWKNGKQPEITEDQVVFWYRVHAKDAQCNQGSATIRNSDMLEDAVFAWAAVTKDSTISMSLGSNTYYDFNADASGPALGSIPFPKQLNGDRPVVAIMQGGKTAYYGEGSKPVTSWCSTKNFNPVVNLVGQGSDNRGHS
jgi:glucan endo-1,3-alpha-glucosidase